MWDEVGWDADMCVGGEWAIDRDLLTILGKKMFRGKNNRELNLEIPILVQATCRHTGNLRRTKPQGFRQNTLKSGRGSNPLKL